MSVNLDNTAYLTLSGGSPSFNSPHTRMAWVRRPAGLGGILFSDVTTYQNTDSCRTTSTGQLVTTIYSGASGLEEQSTANQTLPDDTWEHVACVRVSATELRLYVGGSLVQTLSTHDVSARGAGAAWSLGHWELTPASNYSVHAVKVFDSALTEVQITEEMGWSLPVLPAYSAFVDDPTVDVSGNSRPWTVVGTLGTAGSNPDIGYDPNPPVEPPASPGSLISLPPYPHLRLKMKDYATRQGIFNAYLLS